ncbi:unnamed protein product [Macrosiphum euphorbiae]|uniref:PiggyBac transposable element-derived protein domain-containing protein n=1 Tax=Macrosiphum euphorbiae TaxID=13131 RepID=A0AAV0XW33_9HEMI|nr:unnamed protein product [Macrosiphum euphorbiae]
MGGVDKHDQMVSYYRTFLKSKKWTLRALFHVFDMTVVNCWLEYKQDAANLDLKEKDIMDLLAFKQRLTESLMLVEEELISSVQNVASIFVLQKKTNCFFDFHQ